MFIAEIGINHNGDLQTAYRLINMARMAGVEVVKFQKRTLPRAVPPSKRDDPKDTPWGHMTYLEYKERIEFGKEEFDKIDEYCKSIGMQWTASAWDLPAAKFLIDNYDLPFIKIPSAKITDTLLLAYVANQDVPIIISTGMSTETEIDTAVNMIEDTWEMNGKKDKHLTIMHCNSSYPAKDEELNLSYINVLKKRYPQHYIGYSGHEEGISASIVASVMGALVIERHITLSRSMWGTDQAASITYDQLYRLVRDLKKVPLWFGDGRKHVYDSEVMIKSKLRG